MAAIRITIKTDNAAFGVDPEETGRRGWELARILHDLADQLSHGGCGPPRDINGNLVGTVEILDEKAGGL